MLLSNPFSELSAFISPAAMQGYVILMFLLVIGGTVLDMLHKKSAQYFFENAKKAEKSAKRSVSGGEKAVACNLNAHKRSFDFIRILQSEAQAFPSFDHVWIRILFVATDSAIMIFAYPTPATPTPGILPLLWHVGALMLCVGGYWFWFFIRVDVSIRKARNGIN